jgi:hypothetical protein
MWVQTIPAPAQKLCDVPARTYPCVVQPKENDPQVTGYLGVPGSPAPAVASVTLNVGGVATIRATTIDDATLEVTFTLPFKLAANVPVTISIAGDGNSGSVPVAPAKPPKICGSPIKASDVPCVAQPHEGDVDVTGSWVDDNGNTDNPPSIRLKINDAEIAALRAQVAGGKFTFSGVHSLSQYDTVEAFYQRNAADPVATTNKVTVKATADTDLKLTIPATSAALDFGLQMMQTTTKTQKVTIENKTDKDIDIYDPATTITSNNYTITSNSCMNTLAKKTGTCSFEIAYDPITISTRPGCVERDFIVIVPKTSEARQQFDDLLDKFRNTRDELTVSQCRVASTSNAPGAAPPDHSTGSHSQADKKKAIRKSRADQLAADQHLRAQMANPISLIPPFTPQFQTIALTGTPIHWQYPLTRAVVGVDISAPSAQDVKQAYFVDFDLLAPLALPWTDKFKNQDPLENRLWLWFNPRITSLPQAANFSALSTINETGSFLSQETSKGTLDDIQGIDVSGGFEFAIVKPRDGIPWWAGYTNTQARLSPSLIIGGGAATPFSTDNTDVISQVNAGICSAFAAPSGTTQSGTSGLVCKTNPASAPGTTPVTPASTVIVAPNGPFPYVDFYAEQRSRFYRKVYGGFRLKTYFFSKTITGNCLPVTKRSDNTGDCEGLYDIFPGIIDLTVGKDEAVTAGHLSTWIFRMDAVYPLPFKPSIHLFASTYTALKANRATQPFNSYVINTPTTGSNNDSNTFRYALQPLDRDYFRVGIGVDLVQLFKKPEKGGQPTSPTASAAAAAAAK